MNFLTSIVFAAGALAVAALGTVAPTDARGGAYVGAPYADDPYDEEYSVYCHDPSYRHSNAQYCDAYYGYTDRTYGDPYYDFYPYVERGRAFVFRFNDFDRRHPHFHHRDWRGDGGGHRGRWSHRGRVDGSGHRRRRH